MHFKLLPTVLGLVSIATTSAIPRANQSLATIQLPVMTVASLSENNTFLENLAVRRNGDIVISMLEKNATLYYVKNPTSQSTKLTPIHTFPNANGLLGIGEISEDTFLVAMHNFKSFLDPYPETGAVWEVKFVNKNSQEISVREVTKLPDVAMMNGMAVIPTTNSQSQSQSVSPVLIADTLKGQLIRLDPSTGHYETVLDIPELHAPEGSLFPTGVNGLKIHKGNVYWTNTARLTINRISVDARGYPLKDASVETFDISFWKGALDDFIFDKSDNIWGVNSLQNTVYVLFHGSGNSGLYSTYQTVAGDPDSLEIAGPTAITWGRGKCDKKNLYVTTSGGTVQPINGKQEPAKVVSIDTSSFQAQ